MIEAGTEVPEKREFPELWRNALIEIMCIPTEKLRSMICPIPSFSDLFMLDLLYLITNE